jgi:hypothetical protein
VPSLEIAGSWIDAEEGQPVIFGAPFSLLGGLDAVIEEFDNDTNTLIASAFIEDMPIYAKLVWIEPEDQDELFICAITASAGSLEEARETPDTSDATSLESGCNEGPWQYLYRAIEVAGVWSDGETTFEISFDYWDDQSIYDYSNADDLVITQNPEGGPDELLFNMIAWRQMGTNALAYCVVSEDQPTSEDAFEGAFVPDPEDLGAGCDGASWTVVFAPGSGGVEPTAR